MSTIETIMAEPAGQESEFGLKDILLLLRRRAFLIAAMTVVWTVSAVVIAISLQPKYQATATVLIDPRKTNFVEAGAVVSGLKTDTATIESEVELIRSQPIIDRVIRDLDLGNDPEFAPGKGAITKLIHRIRRGGRSVEAAQETPDRELQTSVSPISRMDEALYSSVRGNLKVARRRITYMIEITFRSGDAYKSALVANAIADAYLKDQRDWKYQTTELATRLLEQRLEELRRRVSESEQLVEKFKATHKLVNAGGGQTIDEKQMTKLVEQIIVARANTAEALAKYEQVRKIIAKHGAKGSISNVLHSLVIKDLRREYADVTRRAADLRTKYGPRHPAMAKVLAEKRDLEQQIAAEVSRNIENLQHEYQSARIREGALIAGLNSLTGRAADKSDMSVKLRQLEREAKANRDIYEAFLARFKQTAEQQGFQFADARVVERAAVPPHPSFPKKKKIVAAAMAGGMVIGVALAFLLEFLSVGVKTRVEAERSFGVRHLASIPMIEARPGGPKAGGSKYERHVISHPASAFTDAIQGLKAALRVSGAGPNPKLVLVSSAIMGEGKSVIASNLAQYASLSGSRALLVDADLRRADISRRYGLRDGPGLVDCLRGEVPVADAVRRDPESRLHVLAASTDEQSARFASDILACERTGELLTALRADYDFIVIDAPPVLPVSDARVLVPFADALVFVIKWRGTPTDLIREAFKTLDADRGKIAGTVFSQADLEELGKYEGYSQMTYRDPRPAQRWARSLSAWRSVVLDRIVRA